MSNQNTQYRDVTNDRYLSEEEKDRIHAQNCAPGYHTNMTYEQRLRAASNFGPNWASILAGHGDQ